MISSRSKEEKETAEGFYIKAKKLKDEFKKNPSQTQIKDESLENLVLAANLGHEIALLALAGYYDETNKHHCFKPSAPDLKKSSEYYFVLATKHGNDIAKTALSRLDKQGEVYDHLALLQEKLIDEREKAAKETARVAALIQKWKLSKVKVKEEEKEVELTTYNGPSNNQ